MLRPPDLLAAVGLLAGRELTATVLNRVCRELARLLAVDGVAVTVTAGNGTRVVVGASDAVPWWLELAELTAGVGPFTEATTTATTVAVADLAAVVNRWPGLREQLVGAPVIAVAATPLRSGPVAFGSLDAYRRHRHLWTDVELADIAQAAAALGFGLAAAHLPGVDNPDLRDDSDSGGSRLGPAQAAVAQATGMVMAALGLSAPDAVDRLRGTAFLQGRLITDIATDITSSRLPATLP